VEYNKTAVLIDATPDFREQMLREKIVQIDALLLTHKHADHLMGIPDIRSYTAGRKTGLPLYGSTETCRAVQQTFPYIFDPHTFVGGGVPNIAVQKTEKDSFSVGDMSFEMIYVRHGSCAGCVGYRFGDVAYIPDMKEFLPGEEKKLHGVRLLIIDCLRTAHPHSTHLILPEAMAISRRAGAQQTLFTHMCHGIHYKKDKHYLDSSMDFAWDGLQLEL
jgi:phosphoribosyl 1,2-cyclic phosphate phosphodiesterase